MSGASAADEAEPRLPVLGLTGAPGAGKSAVADLLAARGGVVVDADRLAREASREPAVLDAVAAWWGAGVLGPDGGLDRAAVAAIVFADRAQRERLEALLHPRVAARRRRIHADAAADPAARLVVEDCPLLLESGLAGACDAVWLVDAPRDRRLARVSARGWDAAELDRREASQAGRERREERADLVVDNGGTRAELEEAVGAALAGFLGRATAADAAHAHPGSG